MVLQRDVAIPVWGWADPGERITVTAGSETATGTAGNDGKWSVKLGRLAASDTPVEMTIAGKNQITLHDVLIGDVWVCSGQSNMEYGMGLDVPNKNETAKANLPGLRLFVVPKVVALNPAEDIGAAHPKELLGSWQANWELLGSWQVCTPVSVLRAGTWMGFPAVGYYFGQNLHASTGKPVGMIASSWGGSSAQAWTSLDALQSKPQLGKYAQEAINGYKDYQGAVQRYPARIEEYKAVLEKWNTDNKDTVAAYNTAIAQWSAEVKANLAIGKPLPRKPAPLNTPKPPPDPAKSLTATFLFNAMIAPLIPYAIKGVIWYQGEANVGKPEYRLLFSTMITDWRNRWGQGDFPFLFAQLANFTGRKADPGDSPWAALREAQVQTLSIPNTGMAVCIDIGEGGDIHPKDKWDVAARLTLAARRVAYGEDIPFSGPLYKEMKIEGATIRIEFDHAGTGLTIGVPPEHFQPGKPRPTTNELQGFAIAGADHKFVWANATIDGDAVLVSSDAVANPVAVRYAWADNPAANLYNKAGLPASPFRTDTKPPGRPAK